MKKEPLISIIVPIYNVEKYIEKCITSLINQTYKNIEILLINDGTTDNSEIIIKKYINNPKVKYYKKKNGGLSDARNYGYQKSSGEYIGFVDSDDWIEENMYEEMLGKMLETNAEMAIGGVRYIDINNKTLKEFIPQKLEMKDILLASYACNKLYSRVLFENIKIKFPVGECYEDLGVIPYLFINSTKTIIIEKIYYNYLQREGSITKTQDLRILDLVKQYTKLKKYLVKNNIYNKYSQDYEICYSKMKIGIIKALAGFNTKFLFENYKIILKKLNEAEDFRKIDYIKLVIIHILKKLIKNSKLDLIRLKMKT